jgi:hypothetical protein
VNNTFRQVGGAIGIAVLGSILASIYRSRINPYLKLLPTALRAPAESSITGTLQVLRSIGGPARAYVLPAENAFMHAMHITWLAGAIVVFAAAIVVFLVAPAASTMSHCQHPSPVPDSPDGPAERSAAERN